MNEPLCLEYINELKERLLQHLRFFEQEQLITFWEELSPGQRLALADQIDRIDFEQIDRLYHSRGTTCDWEAILQNAEEPVAFRLSDARETLTPYPQLTGGGDGITPADAIVAGEAALRAGKIAVAVVAGGQGTRLGFHHAKGIYSVGPVHHTSLFRIHVERILAVAKKYGVRIPFCIQTSPATHQETIFFFQENRNFGLDNDDVYYFCQETMPSVDWDSGKILLADKGEIARSPDGHGGFLTAINKPIPDSPDPTVAQEGVLAALLNRGIDELFYFQVDNPLIDICSPEFIGYHLLARSEFSSQVVRKAEPLEKVGNMVLLNGALHVVEYSDLPESVARWRKEDGSLKIWAGSIAVHLMNIPFLRCEVSYSDSMPFHIAKKKVPYIVTSDSDSSKLSPGSRVRPEQPNAVKFEKFIFDLLPRAKNPIVVEVNESTAFAPLKNHASEKKDNLQTVQAGLRHLYQQWITSCGGTLADDVTIEISPLFANSARELKQRTKEPIGILADSAYWSNKDRGIDSYEPVASCDYCPSYDTDCDGGT